MKADLEIREKDDMKTPVKPAVQLQGNQDHSAIVRGENLEVSKSGRTILQIDDISVTKGEILAVIGPNGAGKSTLLSVLACLEFPKRGQVRFKNQMVTKRNVLEVRRQMAVVFQEPLLLDGTVEENVKMGLSMRGRLNHSETKIAFWLNRFGLTEIKDQLAHTLSGGEAQRTSLARAFVLEPLVLFLDEPFASLDAITKRDLLAELKSVLDESGTTTTLVTHDFREVEALADRVIILNEGKVQAQGTPEEITKHPLWQKLTI